jgi:hypothetical protein
VACNVATADKNGEEAYCFVVPLLFGLLFNRAPLFCAVKACTDDGSVVVARADNAVRESMV